MSDRADEDAQGLEPLTALGEAIRTLRAKAQLSQEALARNAELEASTLAAVEAGQEEPTWGDLRRIARGLETPLKQLLELAESLESPTGAGPGAGSGC
jgi:transcriptional regulator with XRE-family HTH domain